MILDSAKAVEPSPLPRVISNPQETPVGYLQGQTWNNEDPEQPVLSARILQLFSGNGGIYVYIEPKRPLRADLEIKFATTLSSGGGSLGRLNDTYVPSIQTQAIPNSFVNVGPSAMVQIDTPNERLYLANLISFNFPLNTNVVFTVSLLPSANYKIGVGVATAIFRQDTGGGGGGDIS
jgi:hypothetical protein